MATVIQRGPAGSKAPARRTSGGARQAFVLLHRWAGLLLCLWFFLVALSGTVLLWRDEVDVALNPDWMTRQETGPTQPLESLFAAGASVLNEPRDCMLGWPHAPVEVFAVYCDALDRGYELRPYIVFVDPASARVLGWRDRDAFGLDRRQFIPSVFALHSTLFLGDKGYYVTGTAGLALVFLLVSGLVVWWPKTVKALRKSLFIARGTPLLRKLLDLHRTFGLYAFPILLVAASTGASMAFYDAFLAGLRTTGTLSLPPPKGEAEGRRSVSIDEAVRRLGPDARIEVLQVPNAGEDRYAAFLRPGEHQSTLWLGDVQQIHYRTGEVLFRREPQKSSLADRIHDGSMALHLGKAFPPAGKIVLTLGASGLAVLAVTGPWLWLRRRRKSAPRA